VEFASLQIHSSPAQAEQAAVRHGITAARQIIASWNVELEDITQSLDEALRLLEDPQPVYETMPEGMKLLLMQAVFEKIWVVDRGVVGCELTDAVAELLTLEARLAVEEEQGHTGDKESAARNRDTATYHRRREALIALDHLNASWERPVAERPHGALTVDDKYLGLAERGVSNIEHLAGVRGFKLNPELRSYLVEHFDDWRDNEAETA
jgi:hypothetical protein